MGTLLCIVCLKTLFIALIWLAALIVVGIILTILFIIYDPYMIDRSPDNFVEPYDDEDEEY
jgi:hypothetical protein